MVKFFKFILNFIASFFKGLLWWFDLERPGGGLSHSKLFSLITIGILVYVCVFDITNIAGVIAAIAGNIASTANYIHRRVEHNKHDIQDG